MSHSDVLKLLFPLKIGGVFDDDIAQEGAELDACQVSAEKLLQEMFPDLADLTIEDWERVCGLTPADTATLQQRRDAVVIKLRAKGSLKRTYFEEIAADLGYDVDIEEVAPNDGEGGPETIFIWRITVNDAPVYEFRAGESEAGEVLLDWDDDNVMETMFEDLKPAHTRIDWSYA